MRSKLVRQLIESMHNQGFLWAITKRYYRENCDGYWRSLKFFSMTSSGLHKIEELHFHFA